VGIRQKLNEAPKAGIAAVAVLVVGVYAVVAWEIRSPRFGSHVTNIRSYYSDDDGQSYFSDESGLMPPFDHHGSPAVRCYVFECKGQKFVGYLEKYTDDLLKSINTPFDPKHRTEAPLDFNGGSLVKKPGNSEWVKEYSAKGQAIVKVQCPDGSGDVPKATYP
jgi:hypothetical protein